MYLHILYAANRLSLDDEPETLENPFQTGTLLFFDHADHADFIFGRYYK